MNKNTPSTDHLFTNKEDTGNAMRTVSSSNKMLGKCMHSVYIALMLLLTMGIGEKAHAQVSVAPAYTTVCAGSGIGLTASASGSTIPYTYSWAPASGLSATTGISVTATPAATTVYTVTMLLASTVVSTATAIVNVNSVPSVSLTSGGCLGSTYTVTTMPAAGSIVWSSTSGTLLTHTPGWNTNGVTVAGTSGSAGSSASQLNGPSSVYVDASGNIYVADQLNDRIQKWPASGTAGVTVAGTTGVSGSTAGLLDNPDGVYVDASNNVYITDRYNSRVQKWAPAATVGTTVAGGTYGSGFDELSTPFGLSVDAAGNIYIADADNDRLMEWTPGATSGAIIGGGSGYGSAVDQLAFPISAVTDAGGNVYTADNQNNRIQMLVPGSLDGITVAGSATGISGSGATDLNGPNGVYVDGIGNVYIADGSNNRIQLWTPGATSGTTIAGSTGVSGSTADLLSAPTGIFTDINGNVFVGDYSNARVQEFTDTIINTYAPSVAGTYSVMVTSFNGCSAVQAFTVSPALVIPAITGGSTICVGGTTLLSDAVSSGSWSSSDATVASIDPVSGLVGGIGAGTVTVTYSVTGSCGSAVSTTTVTVGTPPATGTISGTYILCIGATSTFTDAGSAGAGTWSSSSTGVASVDITSGVVTAISTGSASISYTIFGSCGSASTYSVISVSPTAVAGTISSSVACIGATTTLTDVGGVGTGSWSTGDATIATINATSGVLGGIATGTVAVTYSVTTACSSASTTSVFTVSPTTVAGTISGTYTVCPGATTTLADAGSVGTGVWSSTSSSIATVSATGVVTGIAAGTTNISYSVTSVCGSAYTHSVVTVSPSPAAGTISGATAECIGATVTLTDAGSVGVSTWSSSSTGVATVSATGAVTGLTAGTTNISYSVTNSCGTASTYSVMTVNPYPVVGPVAGTFSVCVGSTTTLSNSAAGGTWSSATASVATIGSSSGVLGGIAAGTSVVNYSVTATGCTSVATATVTALAVPVVNPVTGTSSVCQGSAILLADVTSGGVWSSSDATIATVTTTGIVGGVAAGVINIAYSVTNASGCSTVVTHSVTVNVPAVVSAITGPLELCSGATAVLVDTSAGGAWSSSNTGVATISSSGSIAGISVGDATISYTIMSLCGGPAIATYDVHVNETVIPTVGISAPSDSACKGSHVTFTATAVNGGSAPAFVWVVNGVNVGTGSTYTYIPVNGDVVRCKLHGSSVCIGADTVLSNTIHMTVDTLLIPVVTVFAAPGPHLTGAQIYTFTATATNGGGLYSYSWYVNGVPTGDITSTLLDTFVNGDSVSCMVLAHGPCGEQSFNWYIAEVYPEGISVIAPGLSNINLFPNPNKGTFSVKGNLATTADQAVTFEVSDVLGQIIYNKTATAHNGLIDEQLSMAGNLADGVYTLTIRSGTDRRVVHFVVGKQ